MDPETLTKLSNKKIGELNQVKNMNSLKNNREALTLGLTLSITAPTEQQSKQALKLVEQIAAAMTDKEIQDCKQQVIKNLS